MMTGYSDAQLTRLIKKKKDTRVIRAVKGNRHTFEKTYTPEDVALLIKTDAAHDRLSGVATRKILEREYAVYGKKDYERLSKISSSHIYRVCRRMSFLPIFQKLGCKVKKFFPLSLQLNIKICFHFSL